MSAESRRSEAAALEDTTAPVCALLAELLGREVDAGLCRLLGTPAIGEILEQAEPGTAELWRNPWSAAVEEEHAVEFCRLFIRPGVCLPVAERWVREVPAEQFSVRRWFDGEDPGPSLGAHLAELPDSHVAKILAVRSGLAEAPEELRGRFEEEMMWPWCRPFADRLVAAAELPLYRAVGSVLRVLG